MQQTRNVTSDFFLFLDYFVIMWRKIILCHRYMFLFNNTMFFSYLDRHQVMYPLQFTRLLGLVDVEVLVDAGGPSSQVKNICMKYKSIVYFMSGSCHLDSASDVEIGVE